VKKFVKAFTYAPKIPAVLDGRCTQTIRAIKTDDPDKIPIWDDQILFHGWEGKPYRSKWSWRLRVEVEKFLVLELEKTGLTDTMNGKFYPWAHPKLTYLAELDFIDPPTGEALGKLLLGWYGPGQLLQVIRFKEVVA